jgi:hypothetical protein
VTAYYRAMTRTVVALLVVAACSRAGSGKKLDEGAAQPGSALEVIAAAGDRGAVVVAMWPAGWDRLDELQAAVAKALPEAARPELQEIAGELRKEIDSPWSVVRAAAKRLRLPVPDPLATADAARPIVLSIAEPVGDCESTLAAAAAALAAKGAMPPAGLRSRIVIPVADPRALADSLEATTGRGLGRLDAGVFGDGERLVRIAAERSWVVVDLVTGANLGALDQAGRARMLGPVRRPAKAVHPLFAGARPSAVRVHVRLDRVAAAGMASGTAMIVSALAEVREPEVVRLLAAGWSEVLAAPLVADPASTLFSDLVIDLPAAAMNAPAAYLLATDAGMAALAADPTLAAGTTITSVDVQAIGGKAPRAPIFQKASSLGDLATPVHECGWACMVYLGLGNGLPLLAAAERFEPGIVEQAWKTPGLPAIRVALAGRVLVVEPLEPAKGAAAWAGAITPPARPAPSAAEACFQRALVELRGDLRFIGHEEAARTREVADHFLEAAKADLDCAAGDRDLAPRVAAIRAGIGSIRDHGGP